MADGIGQGSGWQLAVDIWCMADGRRQMADGVLQMADGSWGMVKLRWRSEDDRKQAAVADEIGWQVAGRGRWVTRWRMAAGRL